MEIKYNWESNMFIKKQNKQMSYYSLYIHKIMFIDHYDSCPNENTVMDYKKILD